MRVPSSSFLAAAVFLALACSSFGGTAPRTLAGGERHTISLKPDGSLLAWGDNSFGQLGDGTTVSHATPGAVSSLTGVVAISAGARHSLALKNDGTVWAWGSNGSGQLGDGTTTARSTPVRVNNLTNIIAISAGNYHNLALRSDGTLWVWGSNGSGRLGDGTTTQRNSPVALNGIANVAAIAGGNQFSLAVKVDGTVWSWGNNANGQLGDGTAISHSTPAQVSGLASVASVSAGDSHSFALTTSGSVYAWGNNGSGRLGDGTTMQKTVPVLVSALSGITDIQAGVEHSIALRNDGIILTFGNNLSGQLGDSTVALNPTPSQLAGISGAIAIAAGFDHSLVELTTGAILVWGLNDYGEIGNGLFGTRSNPAIVPGLIGITKVAAGDNYGVALKSDSTLASWGDNSYGQLGDGTTSSRSSPISIPNFSGVTSISAGAHHTLALKNDGTVWAWGSNGSGQVGDGTTTQRSSPVRVGTLTGVVAISAGSYHSLALKSDGTVWAWGSNGSGRLGNGSTSQRNSPVQVSLLANVSAIAGGGTHSLAVRSDGSLWAWGGNSNGQLGDGTAMARTTPVQITSVSAISKVAAGDSHSFAITSTGSVYAWGNNGSGRLGDNTTTQRNAPVLLSALGSVTQVLGGVEHSLSLGSTGLSYGWGDNLSGQLGDGTHTQRNSPQQIPGLFNIIGLAAGAHFSLALKSTGEVLSWGSNDSGQIGDGSIGMELTPSLIIAPTDNNHNGLLDAWEMYYFGYIGVDPNADPDGDGLTNLQEFQYGTNPNQPDPISTLPAVAAGDFHTLALGSNGMVWTWGLNASGQLGDATTIVQKTLPATVAGLRNVRAIAAGEYHSMALTRDGKVVTWGQNKIGQLGNGTNTDRSSFAPVITASGVELSGVVAIAAGSFHNLALTSAGKVYAWGGNSNGQLGTNNTADQYLAVEIPNLSGIIAIAAGGYHSLAITSNGTLLGWGANFYGALDSGVAVQTTTPTPIQPDLTNIVAVAAGGYHSMAIRADGTAAAWGWNGYGELGDATNTNRSSSVVVSNLTNVRTITGSLLLAGHSAAITSSGALETWGGNTFGQLGNGFNTSISIPASVNNLQHVVALAAGGYHTVAVTGDGSVYLWGYNAFGQLGDGTTADKNVPEVKGGFTLLPQMDDVDGDNLPDYWEVLHFANLDQTSDGDFDGDGMSNLEEFQQARNPTLADNVPVSPAAATSQLVNGSGRAPAGTGENTIIAGFIIQGDAPKRVLIRALGPSLSSGQPPVPNPLPDPRLELFDGDGVSIAQNDNWQTSQLGGIITADQVVAIQGSTLAPSSSTESAMIVTLEPGNYTAQIHAANNATGIALLDFYDLAPNSSEIVNVSARARLSTGDNVLIGGFTIKGNATLKAIVRAIGPSLSAYGIIGALQDPTLELHDASGAAFAFNDNWRDPQPRDIIASGIPPADDRESAIITQLSPGAYTAIVRGKDGTSGVALIEAYDLQTPGPPQEPGVTAAFSWSFDALRMTADAHYSSSLYGPIVQYQWEWGDGTPVDPPISTSLAVHSYSTAWRGRSPRVTLNVWDQTGRTAIVQKLVAIGSSYLPTPTPTPTPSPTPIPTPSPTPRPTASPTPSPTPTPTATARPSPSPTATATATPTATPTAPPCAAPTPLSTPAPSPAPYPNPASFFSIKTSSASYNNPAQFTMGEPPIRYLQETITASVHTTNSTANSTQNGSYSATISVTPLVGPPTYSGSSEYHQAEVEPGDDTDTCDSISNQSATGCWWGSRHGTSGDGDPLCSDGTFQTPAWSWLSGGTLTSQTATSKTYTYNDGTSDYARTITDSNPYADDTFMADVIAKLPAYGDWNDHFDTAIPVAIRHLAPDSSAFSVNKVMYKIKADSFAVRSFQWMEVFVPDDDPKTPAVDESKNVTLLRVLSWQGAASQVESPEYSIDPSSSPQNGSYYLVPFELKQSNYPTTTDTTDLGPTQEQRIGLDGIAYITGGPEMPALEAQVGTGSLPGLVVEWRMEIKTERAERGTKDDSKIPPAGKIETPIEQSWLIYNYYAAPTDFFGGKCTIYYRVKRSDGTYLGNEQTFVFKIRGKNPKDADAKSTIASAQGSYRFAWAIAQHESRQSGNRVYNEFNSSGTLKELPNYSADGFNGWGLFQRDDTGGGIYVDTKQVYNWQENLNVALQELAQKEAAQQRFFGAVAAAYPNDQEAQSPPSDFVHPGTTTSMTALEAGIVTLYNGTGGCPASTLGGTTYTNPWKYNTANPSGQRWEYHPNTNNYVYKVIHDEYEGNLATSE